MKKFLAMFFILGLSANAFSVERPTPEEIKKIVNYYNQGTGMGAILVQAKICKEIQEEGDLKNECKTPLIDAAAKEGDKLLVWLNFMVPTGDTADLSLEFKRKGRVRKVANFQVPSSFRYRTWKSIPTDESGSWTVNIVQELGDEFINLGSIDYEVE